MTSNGSRPPDERPEAALSELRERAEEIRDAIRVRILTAGNLRQATRSANETAEDVAQAVFLKLWALIRDGDPGEIRDLKAYAKKMADNHVASLLRRPVVRRIELVDPDTVERLVGDRGRSHTADAVVEHRLSEAQVESIVGTLKPEQALLIKMRVELGMSVPEMAKVIGQSPKSCEKQLERAIDRIKQRLAELEDLDAADRRRISRVMAVKRWGTPSLVAALQRDMRADLRLASIWRQSNGALHDVAGAVAIDESLSRAGTGPRLIDRAMGLIERARDAAVAAAGRSGPEHEAAAGAAAGGAGVAKAMVAVCLAGSAAGGACVATGVIDLPQGPGRSTAEKPAAETETTTGTTPEVSTVDPATPVETVTPTQPQPEQPIQPVDKELYGSGSSSASGSTSGSRDFAAPVGSSGTSGGGGSNSGRESFGP